MKEQIDILVKLQKIESESAQIHATLKSVSEKLAGVESRRQEFEQTLEDQSVRIDELKKQYRSLEADSAQQQSLIDKSHDKLRSVKTNKEYQSSLKEIDDLKRKTSQLEDDMLACLDQVDALETTLSEKKTTFKQLALELEQEKRAIQQEAAKDEARLAKLNGEKTEVAGLVNKALLDVFWVVKGKQSAGAAIVPVIDAACQGCNVHIPPQMYNELQRCDKLQFCPNCQRIIYWDQS